MERDHRQGCGSSFTEGIFNVLDFSDEAIDIFYDWQNEDIERQNAITDENDRLTCCKSSFEHGSACLDIPTVPLGL